MIHAFEFTHELAWNVLKDYLEAQGYSDVVGSRGATRLGFQSGLIQNGDVWMQMIMHRNQSSHTYNDDVARAIVSAIRDHYVSELGSFLEAFAKRKREAS
jgi:nucleotidyltransferase substrate binding protein (TIGR01987 family)